MNHLKNDFEIDFKFSFPRDSAFLNINISNPSCIEGVLP